MLYASGSSFTCDNLRVYTPFTKQTDSTSELLIMSIGNALTLLCVVIVMTVILILLYKFRWYKV